MPARVLSVMLLCNMDFETVLEFKEINILQCIHNYFKNKYFGLKMQFSSLVSTTKKKKRKTNQEEQKIQY